MTNTIKYHNDQEIKASTSLFHIDERAKIVRYDGFGRYVVKFSDEKNHYCREEDIRECSKPDE